MSALPVTAPEGAVCAHHPAIPAQNVCARCGDFLCWTCTELRPQVGVFCSRCAPEQLIRSSPGSRVAAHMIDGFLVFGGVMIAAVVSGLISETEGDFALFAIVAPAMALPFGILQCVLIHRRAQSVGKALVGIRLATLDGGKPGLARVLLLRNLIPMLITEIPLLGPLFGIVNALMLFGEERRCLHDRMAGTIVVDTPERAGKLWSGGWPRSG